MELRPREGAPLGVYVHFPFCLRRCPYCDFNVRVARQIPHEAYLEAVLRELDARGGALAGRRLASIYLGGGTPGLWEAGCVARLLEALRSRWALLADPVDAALGAALGEEALEVTVEVNPASAPREHLEALRAAGVNRLSLGAQSFDAAWLRELGRDHEAAQIEEALAAARAAGFSRLSVDLIHGGVGQSRARQRADLARVEALGEGVDHVSVYELTIEPQTAFGRRHARGELAEAPEEEMVAMYLQARDALQGAGLLHYEIGSFARAGRYARHNSLYWRGGEYLGLGLGAHELQIQGGEGLRREGARSLKAYMADPASARRVEVVTAREHLFERVFLGMRTRYGVSMEDIGAQFGGEGERYLGRCLEALAAQGWVEAAQEAPGAPGYLLPAGQRWGPTPLALLQADSVAAACLEVLDSGA